MDVTHFLSTWGISLGICLMSFLFAYLFSRLFTRYIKRSVAIVKNDPTNYKLFRHAISGLIVVVGFAIAFQRIDAFSGLSNTLLTGAGILAAASAFASQHALSNIVSGIFIVIFKPFRVHDIVTIRDSLIGTVEDITLRHTVIRDFENRRIIIPNSIISNELVVNSDIEDSRINKRIEIGISYDSDIDLARRIIREEIENHSLHIDGRTNEQIAEGVEKVPIKVAELGDFAVILRIWAWAADPMSAFDMKRDVLESIKKRFDREGIEIPFPHRTIVYKTDITKSKLTP